MELTKRTKDNIFQTLAMSCLFLLQLIKNGKVELEFNSSIKIMRFFDVILPW